MEYVLNLECVFCGILDTSVVFRAFGGLSFKISPQNNKKLCFGYFLSPQKLSPPPPPPPQTTFLEEKKLPETHVYWLSVSV